MEIGCLVYSWKNWGWPLTMDKTEIDRKGNGFIFQWEAKETSGSVNAKNNQIGVKKLSTVHTP